MPNDPKTQAQPRFTAYTPPAPVPHTHPDLYFPKGARRVGSAELSANRQYRYSLRRTIPNLDPTPLPREMHRVVFVGVNPSTADEKKDDATIRKLCGFTQRWGCGDFYIGNLFAFRATNVQELSTLDYLTAIGLDNDHALQEMFLSASLIVPCWGSREKLHPKLWPRIREVELMMHEVLAPKKCFGHTAIFKDPRHPLMLAYATPLIPYEA